MLLYLVAIVTILAAIKYYKWITSNDDYFEKNGVEYIKPQYFIDTAKLFYKREVPSIYFKERYDKFSNAKFFGAFDYGKPLFILRDPQIIKQIGVKDFDHFVDHNNFTDGAADDIFSNSLILLSGDKWRDMRATLSPAFTGSKMRQMFILVRQCATDMSAYFKKQTEEGKTLNFDMKELFSKYTNDVIATSAFGIEVNSFENPDNEFFLMGRNMFKFNLTMILKFLLLRLVPRIAKVLKIQMFDPKIAKFFKTMVIETIDTRIKKNIFRPDMINILKDIVEKGAVQSKSEEADKITDGFAAVDDVSNVSTFVNRKWNDTELAAQCLLFFVAGFDTTSTMLTFAAYELAINPDIQERLYSEILDNENALDGQPLSYENLQKLKYMDMFISEVLRLWPPVMMVDRLCVKNYLLKDNHTSITIEKGTVVWLPIHALHHDRKYYENPEKCEPERFSEENKSNILPGTYLPFGIGPRNCIGSRFALMEIKAVLYAMLLNFKFEPNEETQIPLKMGISPDQTEKGVKLTFTPR